MTVDGTRVKRCPSPRTDKREDTGGVAVQQSMASLLAGGHSPLCYAGDIPLLRFFYNTDILKFRLG